MPPSPEGVVVKGYLFVTVQMMLMDVLLGWKQDIDYTITQINVRTKRQKMHSIAKFLFRLLCCLFILGL